MGDNVPLDIPTAIEYFSMKNCVRQEAWLLQQADVSDVPR